MGCNAGLHWHGTVILEFSLFLVYLALHSILYPHPAPIFTDFIVIVLTETREATDRVKDAVDIAVR